MSATTKGDELSAAYEEGYEDGRAASTLEAVNEAYDEGYADGFNDRSLKGILEREAAEAGLDILDGFQVWWDPAEKSMKFERIDNS